MATVTGLTAARMLLIEGASIVDAEIVTGNLILEKHDGTTIDAGPVTGATGAAGPTGATGPAGGLIPGEVRLWPGDVLPLLADYGLWDWADGGVLAVADYPIAAAHIADQWRTFAGASDPGGANFRKPDLRGLVPAGLDQMPGGSRANRMTRAVSIVLAGKSGEETHVITLAESANHNHGGGNHGHTFTGSGSLVVIGSPGPGGSSGQGFAGGGDRSPQEYWAPSGTVNASGTIITAQGGNGGHENVQPTVFVPYIVKLDD